MKIRFITICIILSLFIAGCSTVDEISQASDTELVVSDALSSEMNSAIDIDYSKYTETNEEFDKDNNLILSNIYDPNGNFYGYRKYAYLEDGSIYDMKTYLADETLKSTVHYEYNHEEGKNSVLVTIYDANDNVIISAFSEYILDENEQPIVSREVYKLNNKLLYSVENNYNDGKINAIYYNADNEAIEKSDVNELLLLLEESAYSLLF